MRRPRRVFKIVYFINLYILQNITEVFEPEPPTPITATTTTTTVPTHTNDTINTNAQHLTRVAAPSKDVALVNTSEQALVISAKEKSTQEKVCRICIWFYIMYTGMV